MWRQLFVSCLLLACLIEVKSYNQLGAFGVPSPSYGVPGPYLNSGAVAQSSASASVVTENVITGQPLNSISIAENVVRPCTKCAPVLIPGAYGNQNGLPQSIITESFSTSYVPPNVKVPGIPGPPLRPLEPCNECPLGENKPCGPVLIPGASGNLKSLLTTTAPSIAQSSITESITSNYIPNAYNGFQISSENLLSNQVAIQNPLQGFSALAPGASTIGFPRSSIASSSAESIIEQQYGSLPFGLQVPLVSERVTAPSLGFNNQFFADKVSLLSNPSCYCAPENIITGPVCPNPTNLKSILPYSCMSSDLSPIQFSPVSPINGLTPTSLLPTSLSQCSNPPSVTTSIINPPCSTPTQVITTTVVDNSVLNSLANTVQLLVINDLLETTLNAQSCCNGIYNPYGAGLYDASVSEVVTTGASAVTSNLLATAEANAAAGNVYGGIGVEPVTTTTVATATATTSTEEVAYPTNNAAFNQPPPNFYDYLSQLASSYYGNGNSNFGPFPPNTNPLVAELASRILPGNNPYDYPVNPYNLPNLPYDNNQYNLPYNPYNSINENFNPYDIPVNPYNAPFNPNVPNIPYDYYSSPPILPDPAFPGYPIPDSSIQSASANSIVTSNIGTNTAASSSQTFQENIVTGLISPFPSATETVNIQEAFSSLSSSAHLIPEVLPSFPSNLGFIEAPVSSGYGYSNAPPLQGSDYYLPFEAYPSKMEMLVPWEIPVQLVCSLAAIDSCNC